MLFCGRKFRFFTFFLFSLLKQLRAYERKWATRRKHHKTCHLFQSRIYCTNFAFLCFSTLLFTVFLDFSSLFVLHWMEEWNGASNHVCVCAISTSRFSFRSRIVLEFACSYCQLISFPFLFETKLTLLWWALSFDLISIFFISISHRFVRLSDINLREWGHFKWV